MGPFEMIVLVVFIACATGMFNSYIKSKSNQTPAADEDLQDQVDELEERVRVLERVVTDDKNNLSREINDLKD